MIETLFEQTYLWAIVHCCCPLLAFTDDAFTCSMTSDTFLASAAIVLEDSAVRTSASAGASPTHTVSPVRTQTCRQHSARTDSNDSVASPMPLQCGCCCKGIPEPHRAGFQLQRTVRLRVVDPPPERRLLLPLAMLLLPLLLSGSSKFDMERRR